MGDTAPVGLTAGMLTDGETIDVGGLPMRLHATQPGSAEALVAFFRAAPATDRAPLLEVVAGTQLPVRPATEPDAETAGILAWRTGETLVAVHPAGVGVRADGFRIEIGVDAAAPGWEPIFRRLLTIALGHAVLGHDRLLFHTGAVLVDGHAVLLVGDSGSGKSTMAWAAWSRGVGVVSDDLVLANLDDGAPLVAGVPRPVTVSASLPGSGWRVLADDPRGRAEAGPVSLTSGTHPVGGSLILSSDLHGPARLDTLNARTVVRALLGASFGLAGPEVTQQALRWAGAVARLPAVEVHRGQPDGATPLGDQAIAMFATAVEHLREQR